MTNSPQFIALKTLSLLGGGTGIIWLLAISEGRSIFLSPELGGVIASSLASAGLVLSAALWIMNLIVDRKLRQFEQEHVAPKFMTINECTIQHEQQDDRYEWIKERLEELTRGQERIRELLDERNNSPTRRH